MDISPQTQLAILSLTSDVVTRRVGGDPRPLPALDDAFFSAPTAGCFVSLHRKGTHALRGCVGLLETGKPLRQVLLSAAESVLGDPRFLTQPVTREELPELEIEVTLLGPMERAKSPLDFEPTQRGIYLTINSRSGLFLPQVARETGWTRQQLLARLCTEKLGMPENAWNDPAAILHTFTAEVIGPKPMI
ncbi:MAG TPA: AmmeMemoRadiSam system protein A [Tepidisphaeraceae bacterium]|jgi:AmmeMemoRadiSam system protein A